MKILAIGATGFVGSRVTRQLIAQGHQVALFHRGNTTASDLDSIVHFYGTRNQLPNFKAQFEQFAPDVMLDIIPFTEAQAQDVVQVLGSFTQRIVAISSGDVYRNYEGLQGQGKHPPDPVPLAEDAPLRETRYPYRDLEGLDFEFKQDYDKILVEQVLMQHPDIYCRFSGCQLCMVLAISNIGFYPISSRCLTSNPFYWMSSKPSGASLMAMWRILQRRSP